MAPGNTGFLRAILQDANRRLLLAQEAAMAMDAGVSVVRWAAAAGRGIDA
jgi:hypothetical protein